MTGQVDERRRARQADGRLAGDPGGVDALAGLRARVDRVARRDVEAGALREAFRRRWVGAGAPAGLAGEGALQVMTGVLFERIGEIVQDVEDGRSDLLPDALAGALATIDRLDAALGEIEAWARAVGAQQGVTLPVPGEASARGAHD